MSYDLPAADLPTKKALNLEDLQKIKSFSLSTTGQLETVNNSTSTPASTVKTSVVLLASEWKAAVSDNARNMWKYSRRRRIYGSKILCYLCQKEENVKYQRENAAKHLKRSAEKMKEVSLKKFKDLSVDSTVLANVPKVDRGPLNGNNIVDNMI
ncbi:hypothetical protein TNIN_53001 [Trichonephila inaurata madagascariensis]|uniref:SCAN domain-containing protein n=1 Tax=Trichonephila inaurata madagascariensis TaxID=2747483 RepID=A0A8X6X7Q2_9ARAC|nr:hypothetical protein TNIN_53001 [Trichonephila inaurata madagascariensis]